MGKITRKELNDELNNELDKINNIEENYSTKEELQDMNDTLMSHLAQIAVNINEFGVVGDSINGDTETFQRAINSGHSVIYFPDGEYYPLDVEVTKAVKFVGQSKEGTIFKLLDKDGKGMFRNSVHINGFSMRNITVNEQGIANGGNRNKLIEFIDVYPLDFENCAFKEMASGLRFNVTEAHASETISHRPRFSRCQFEFSQSFPDVLGLGSTLDFASTMNDGLIEYCEFTNIRANGIRVYPFGSTPNQIAPKRWNIVNNIFNNVRRYDPEEGGNGVYTGSALYYRGDDLVFEGNRVINVKRQPIDVQGINDQQTIAKNIRIINNFFRNDDGFSDYRQAAICLFRNAEVQFINNTLICDKLRTQARGIELKWGGSLIATGNTIINSFRDAIEISHSSLPHLSGTISHVVIADNVFQVYGSDNTFSAIRIRLAQGKYIPSVIINNNTSNQSMLRVIKDFEGYGDIRRLSATGNTSTTDKSFFGNPEGMSYIWKYNVNGFGEVLSNLIMNSNGVRLAGNLELTDGVLKLPLSASLPSASASNRGRIMIIEQDGEEQAFICLKNTSGIYQWKRIDIDA